MADCTCCVAALVGAAFVTPIIYPRTLLFWWQLPSSCSSLTCFFILYFLLYSSLQHSPFKDYLSAFCIA